jgi:hypothetical protein
MKNAVFWDIKPQFVPHRRHSTSPQQNPGGQCYVRFEVFTAVAMKKREDYEEKWAVVIDAKRWGGGGRIYHRF